VAEGEQGLEEGGPDLRAEAGGDGKETLQRGFLCFDDPQEAAIFPVLVEMMKEIDEEEKGMAKIA
jgi:hypothetical protein